MRFAELENASHRPRAMRTFPMVAAALLAAGACGEPTAPRTYGLYGLASLNGQPAPLVWFDHTFSSGERVILTIVADTLLLLPDGRLRWSEAMTHRRIMPDGMIYETVSAQSAEGSHRQEGNRVIVERVTVYPAPGTRRFDTLTVRRRALEQTKRLGLYCSNEPCPPPRDFLLRYERR